MMITVIKNNLEAVVINEENAILIYHVFSEDSIKIDQTDEKEDTTEDVMNEIDESLLDENDEVEIGEMV